jgi:hybrid cluster-associated redox disulfide protein
MKTIAKNSPFALDSGYSDTTCVEPTSACTIAPELPVDEVMRRWPRTIRIFLDFGFGCVGCPIACFHTVEEASREHRADLEAFVTALNAAA